DGDMLGSLERRPQRPGGAAVVEVVGRQVGLGLRPVDPFERFVDAYRHAWSLGQRHDRRLGSQVAPDGRMARARWRSIAAMALGGTPSGSSCGQSRSGSSGIAYLNLHGAPLIR